MSNLNSVTVKWEHLDSLTRTREVSEASAVWINIEDDCTVHIYASKQEGLDRAKAMIDRIFQKIEVGKVYTGKVVSITQFVALMKVLPGKDGLAEGRTENVEDIVKKGDVITAKRLGVNDKGRVKMSRRAWLCDQKAEDAKVRQPVAAE